MQVSDQGLIPLGNGMAVIGSTPPGTCPECAVVHEPEMPHDAQSLAYQYKFFAVKGYWPNWGDAMAHCTPEVQELWKKGLREAGVFDDKFEVPTG